MKTNETEKLRWALKIEGEAPGFFSPDLLLKMHIQAVSSLFEAQQRGWAGLGPEPVTLLPGFDAPCCGQLEPPVVTDADFSVRPSLTLDTSDLFPVTFAYWGPLEYPT